MSPPLPNESLPGVIFCWSVCFDIRFFFADEAMRGNFVFGEKTSPSFLLRCCPRGSLFFLFWVNRMMGAEGSCGNKRPLPLSGIHFSIFPRHPVGLGFALIVAFLVRTL